MIEKKYSGCDIDGVFLRMKYYGYCYGCAGKRKKIRPILLVKKLENCIVKYTRSEVIEIKKLENSITDCEFKYYCRKCISYGIISSYGNEPVFMNRVILENIIYKNSLDDLI
ncbi:hypothetical protein UFOVP733_40 [uncultured Caudovirales phage]|uniref:Uncharacterized protein n=1 Tax=uncultured Caudovirales phage TaxID=2100421 RepID=A0A6J7X5B5_9CAUD|nr:hypothetical protein UFOVP733_40 [uncultured Caudovirales phage]CAB5224862.1 hypothetical protein UFOVP743_19 [uncultured Caudovirales phage]